MAVERDVHLLLSPKAANILDQILDLSHQSFDGTTVEALDDRDDADPIIEAIRKDIAEQLPERGGNLKKKKPAKKHKSR